MGFPSSAGIPLAGRGRAALHRFLVGVTTPVLRGRTSELVPFPFVEKLEFFSKL